jgi:hypothetical protein
MNVEMVFNFYLSVNTEKIYNSSFYMTKEQKPNKLSLQQLMEMAGKNRKDEPEDTGAETGTGTVDSAIAPKWLGDDDLNNQKLFRLGLAEQARGGPGSKEGTNKEDLRDFGQSH